MSVILTKRVCVESKGYFEHILKAHRTTENMKKQRGFTKRRCKAEYNKSIGGTLVV